MMNVLRRGACRLFIVRHSAFVVSFETDPRLVVSTGDIFEWLRPAAFALAALASAWVFARALRRAFPALAALACALAVLLLPLVFLPLFLAFIVFTSARRETKTVDETTRDETQTDADVRAPDSQPAGVPEKAGSRQTPARRWLPYLYAALVLSSGALYFYRDRASADAHLARAANARLRNQRDLAIREYAAALRLEDDPHTRKLLALELAADARHDEALAQLAAARAGGEPDPLIPLHAAASLDALDRTSEAAAEYRNFLAGELCRSEPADPRCEAARRRVGPDAAP